MRHLLIPIALFLSPMVMAQQKHVHAHEHGKGNLEITLDKSRMVGKLKIPLEALVGFERLPKTEVENNAINDLNQKLANPATFFVMNKEAECSPKVLENTIVRDTAGKHADLHYQFDLNCSKLANLKQMSITLFANYKRLKEIKVESVGPAGQKSTTAKPQSNIILLN